MKKYEVLTIVATVALALAVSAGPSWAGDDAAKAGTATCKGTLQTKCPVMGNAINKDLYVDAGGRRIYVCCEGCIEKVKADPQKYIDKIIANGECPKFVLALCPKCGEVKGTEKCCAEGAEKCGTCSLSKGSPGCCVIKKDAAGEVRLCPKCGEVKGADKCCAKDAAKCDKCGLAKGSPGCCKLDKDLIKNFKGACASCKLGAGGGKKAGMSCCPASKGSGEKKAGAPCCPHSKGSAKK